jgi:hypothetical protein
MRREPETFWLGVCWQGRVAWQALPAASGRQVGEVVARVLAGLGVSPRPWRKAGPQVRVMTGFEGGGWSVVVCRGRAHPAHAAVPQSSPEALPDAPG